MNNESETNLEAYLITTIDNPFSPFDEFEKWYKFDLAKGYNTCEIVGRLASKDQSLTSIEEIEEMNEIVDKIIEFDFLNVYKKVKSSDFKASEA